MEFIEVEVFRNKKGVYKITNLLNGDIYIGSTRTYFWKRFREHLKFNSKKHNCILYKAIIKYGIQNFKFDVLEVIEDPKIILEKEEYYINNLSPSYNICLKPTRGGCPNLNRKLSTEWKENIRIKSSEYKHSEEVLKKVRDNNKKGSSKLKITKGNKVFEGSLIECARYIGCDTSNINLAIRGKQSHSKGWKIEVLKKQSKKITVFLETENITFDSFGKCEKYFNMWRGYISTITLRQELIMGKYNYEIINI